MKLNSKIILFLILGLWCHNFLAQEQDSVSVKLILKSRVTSDAVLLRWAVNDKYAWKYGNEYGYLVERTTITRDGKPLSYPEKVILSGDTIKPKPAPVWESFIQQNDMGAVAAQAIYGESFDVNSDETDNEFLKVFYQGEELEKRFGFGLFAVDRDFETAKYAGLGYADTDIKANEKYFYTIKSGIPKEKIKIDSLGVFINPVEVEELPKPIDFFGYYHKNAFVLVWEYDQLVDYYTAYDLERSEDGITFNKLNETPITKIADTPYSGISFTDSIPEFNKKYWYRIVGMNYFNEKSPPSDAIHLTGIKELQGEPLFSSSEITPDSQVLLQWEFPEEEQWKLNKYELLKSDKAIGPYKTVVDSIAPTQSKYTYGPLDDINYFKLKAFGKHQDYQVSPPVMVQPVDSIPPSKPEELRGIIDTLGVVALQWSKNTELDLKGYDILRAYRPDQEFTKLNKENLLSENYIDTVDMTSFNENIYYRIIALDNRYNASVPSDTLILKKPDRVPPTSPVFKEYEIKDGQVHLSWINSSSDDRKSTVVYRRKAIDSISQPWEKVYETSEGAITSYVDTKINPGTKYHYTLITVDQSDLESVPAPIVVLDIPGKLLKPGVKGLYAKVDRENKFIDLTWRLNDEGTVEIQIYRKTQDSKFIRYKRLDPNEKRFIDTSLIPNTTYTYAFKVMYDDGSTSEWKKIEVVY